MYLVYFTTRVPDTSITNETRATEMQQQCSMRATRARHECDTSKIILILITARVKTYFHIPTLALSQIKDYKDRKNLILKTNFWKYPF